MIIFYILTTLSLDNVWTLLGENCCWSLLGLKGLRKKDKCSYLFLLLSGGSLLSLSNPGLNFRSSFSSSLMRGDKLFLNSFSRSSRARPWTTSVSWLSQTFCKRPRDSHFSINCRYCGVSRGGSAPNANFKSSNLSGHFRFGSISPSDAIIFPSRVRIVGQDCFIFVRCSRYVCPDFRSLTTIVFDSRFQNRLQRR